MFRALAVAFFALGANAHAAVLQDVVGQVWKSPGFRINNLTEAFQVVNTTPLLATWEVSALDYPRGGINSLRSASSTLANFIGPDTPTLTGNNFFDLQNTAYIFSGMIRLEDDFEQWSVSSDDGFRLIVDRQIVGQFDGVRTWGTTTGTFSQRAGLYSFAIVFFERRGDIGIEFTSNGAIVEAGEDPIPDPGEVPIPAAALLLPFGLLTVVSARRLKLTGSNDA
ncbi:MAG: hypothetical protein AAF830_02665 [Pseudomonadota bacterium]